MPGPTDGQPGECSGPLGPVHQVITPGQRNEGQPSRDEQKQRDESGAAFTRRKSGPVSDRSEPYGDPDHCYETYLWPIGIPEEGQQAPTKTGAQGLNCPVAPPATRPFCPQGGTKLSRGNLYLDPRGTRKCARQPEARATQPQT